VDVTSLLKASYGKRLVFEQVAEVAVQKSFLFCLTFICIAEKRLEVWTLSYQQVIHNAKMPTGAIVQATATQKNDAKEALGLYKCL